MPASADVNGGDDATAVQYNDLREDVVDVVTGHGHTGVSEDGKLIGLDGLAQEVKDTLGSPKSIQRFKTTVSITMTVASGQQKAIANQTITAVDLAKSYIVMAGREVTLPTPPTPFDTLDMRARLTTSTNVEIEATIQNPGQTGIKVIDLEMEYQVVEWP